MTPVPPPITPEFPGETTLVLQIRDVSRTFGSGHSAVTAVAQVSLDFRAGELTAILGKSGSGKSTLLNLLGGLDQPTNGTVCFGPLHVSSLSRSQLVSYRKQHIGFVFQFYNLVPNLTALENVQISAELGAENRSQKRNSATLAATLLSAVDLSHRARAFPSELSGGEMQRVAIARAFANNPEVLLCDEPTGALDTDTSARVLDLLKHAAHSHHKTVILVTHNDEIALKADRSIHLQDGRVIADSNPAPPNNLGSPLPPAGGA